MTAEDLVILRRNGNRIHRWIAEEIRKNNLMSLALTVELARADYIENSCWCPTCSRMWSGARLPDRLMKEFRRQTDHLGAERQLAILFSFIGTDGMAECVKLQQSQDGALPPRYWRRK
jgi:hypothetical protein